MADDKQYVTIDVRPDMQTGTSMGTVRVSIPDMCKNASTLRARANQVRLEELREITERKTLDFFSHICAAANDGLYETKWDIPIEEFNKCWWVYDSIWREMCLMSDRGFWMETVRHTDRESIHVSWFHPTAKAQTKQSAASTEEQTASAVQTEPSVRPIRALSIGHIKTMHLTNTSLVDEVQASFGKDFISELNGMYSRAVFTSPGTLTKHTFHGGVGRPDRVKKELELLKSVTEVEHPLIVTFELRCAIEDDCKDALVVECKRK